MDLYWYQNSARQIHLNCLHGYDLKDELRELNLNQLKSLQNDAVYYKIKAFEDGYHVPTFC